MSNAESVFQGDPAQLQVVDIDAPLTQSTKPCCEYYLTAYADAAKAAEQQGDAQKGAVYRFLQTITGFGAKFDTPEEPFGPLQQIGDRRTAIPSDLSKPDILAVRELAKLTKDPALRARLYDVIWECTRDHTAGIEAAASYVAAAERLNTSDDWTYAVGAFKRGTYLAGKFGTNKDLFKNAAAALVKAAKGAATNVDAFQCCQLMELMLSRGIGEPAEFAPVAASIATAASAKGEHRQARVYWEVEADWHKRAKDAASEQNARLAAAETYVVEAANRTKGAGASFMAAAAILADGIEALRRAGAPKDRIEQLRTTLNDYQKQSLSEFETLSTTTDIGELVSRARDHVKCGDFAEALFRLAFGQDLSDPKKLKEEIVEAAKQAPLTYLMGGVIVDHQGRTTKVKPGLFHLKGEELEEALEAEAFSHASRFHWPLRVDAFIEPARFQILNDHHPGFRDLLSVVRNNPFVPPGHEGLFLRGLHAGFHGDWVVASHILVPQIENSLRYVLESHGVDVSNLMSDGTQPVKPLGAIFGLSQTKQIFGEQLCFEFRGSLIEKTGYDFRNRVAHGFVSEAECYSPAAITLWWLVLRVCLFPLFQALPKSAPTTSQQQESPEQPPSQPGS